MISTKGRYALRLMLDLAQNQKDGYVALKDVAARQDISKKYLEQIIPTLAHEGMIITVKGPKGGYRLSKLPDSYSVGDILRAAEGSLAPVSCLEQPENLCPRKETCLTLPVWLGLDRVIREYVDSISLTDILQGQIGNDYII